MSSPERHQHDLLRAELVEDGLMTVVALRENPSMPESLKKAMELKVRQIRHCLDNWDAEPYEVEWHT